MSDHLLKEADFFRTYNLLLENDLVLKFRFLFVQDQSKWVVAFNHFDETYIFINAKNKVKYLSRLDSVYNICSKHIKKENFIVHFEVHSSFP